MNLVSVKYKSKQFYLVEESAFFQVIEKTIESLPNIKLKNEPRISFYSDENNISIHLNIKIKSKSKIDLEIKSLTSSLELEISKLIDIKPKNIQIAFSGFY